MKIAEIIKWSTVKSDRLEICIEFEYLLNPISVKCRLLNFHRFKFVISSISYSYLSNDRSYWILCPYMVKKNRFSDKKTLQLVINHCIRTTHYEKFYHIFSRLTALLFEIPQ